MCIFRRGRGVPQSASGIALLLFVLGFLSLTATGAHATRWLCPNCAQVVERPDSAKTLDCPNCGKSFSKADMAPPVAYINSRTRDSEVTWLAQGDDCAIFRLDGMEARDSQGVVWVPWSLVEWFIPRFELVRLKNGVELTTDYPGGTERCSKPPRFEFEVTDSLNIPGQKPSVYTIKENQSLADLFLVAFSPEERDSARVRFISEVEAGMHPHLPRTQPKVYSPAAITYPPEALQKHIKGETDIEVRVSESRGAIGFRQVKSSGSPVLDVEALRAVRSSAFQPGGELGVGVPAWVLVKVTFDGTAAKVEAVPARRGYWRN